MAPAPERAPLVHVGYSKTGTTWLQRHLFEREAPGPFVPLLTREETIDLLVAPGPLDFDRTAARASCDDRLGAPDLAPPAVPVISHERLIGNPHSGGFDLVTIADRLAGVLPDARILVTIREQQSLLVSLYQQYVKVGGACRMVDYCLPPADHRLPLFDLTYLEFDRAIELYQDRFGPERVLVLPYERFRHDLEGFVAAVCEHVGAPPAAGVSGDEVNVRWSPSLVAMLRWANAVGRRPDSAINPRAGVITVDRDTQRRLRALDRRLPRSLGERIERRQRELAARLCTGRFAASNRRTAALTDLDLGALGYET